MNIGFIGAGNMANAIIKGMTIGTGKYQGSSIYAYNRSIIKTELLNKECGINSCLSLKEVVEQSDVIILAVKPLVLTEVIPQVICYLNERKPLIISIAVGKTLSYFEDYFGEDTPIARVMPNINAKVGASTSAFCSCKAVTDKHKRIINELFSTIGTITEIEESLFSIFGVVAGSAPAFAYLYIDALARAAQKAGMSKKQALEIAAQSVLGSSKMILESHEHPWALIDQVCSPGGTTIEGITTLQSNAFESTITKGFDAILSKDKLIQSNNK